MNYLAATAAVQALAAQQAKPQDFYDNSFVQKLDASGFVNSLYAR
ncbi:MAG: hypothetical protein ACREQV_17475 [Candidatus Binatia bacterium]